MDLAIIENRLRYGSANTLAIGRHQRAVVLDETLEHFPGQIEPIEIGITTLKLRDDAQGLSVVIEATIGQQHLMQRILARMAEGRVPEIVYQRHALGQILIQLEGTRQGASDLRHLDRMRQPGAIVITVLGDEDLRLVLQPTEGGRMDDPVTIALELGARRARPLLIEPSTRFPGICCIDCLFPISETQCMRINRHHQSIPAFGSRAAIGATVVSLQSAPDPAR